MRSNEDLATRFLMRIATADEAPIRDPWSRSAGTGSGTPSPGGQSTNPSSRPGDTEADGCRLGGCLPSPEASRSTMRLSRMKG